jgi:acyl-CoA synthetase (AMP-forming)/AMP-acid ligase II
MIMLVLGEVAKLNARRYPGKTALIMGNHSLTFGQLNKLVNQTAHGLLEMGLKTGDRVAICSRNCLEFVTIVFAVWKCGAILVPLNFRFKTEEMLRLIENSRPVILFHSEELAPTFEEIRKRYSGKVIPISISGAPLEGGKSLQELTAGKEAYEVGVEVDSLSTALIMYTSGTTGFPKGVIFSHYRELSDVTNQCMEIGITNEDIMVVNMPLFHNGGLSLSLMIAFLSGCTCVIQGGPFDPNEMFVTIERFNVSVINVVPTMLAKMIEHPQIGKYNLGSLKKIVYGSSPISENVLSRALSLFKADFYQVYAQTETGMLLVLDPADHATERFRFTGRETRLSDIRVVDEKGWDIPVGKVGEIISRQRPLGMDGYYGMEEATKEVIQDGWIHSGDLVRVEQNGYYTIVDRLKDMIISGAENIYCKEIENVLREYPGVEEAAVFGIPDEMWGEAVCAVIVAKAGFTLKENEIAYFCHSRLAGYKKPKKIEFRDDLPRNAAGKILLHEIICR